MEMGSHSKSYYDITGDSELKDISYKLFQLREHRVQSSNGEFGCPFCVTKEEDYTHLLQHAIRGAEGSISVKQRAKHSAMAKYLAIDIAAEKDLPKYTPTSRKRSASRYKYFVWAIIIIIFVAMIGEANSAPPRRQLAMAEKREKEALDKIRDLEKKISEMGDEMNALITKERSSNDELQLVREELLRGLSDVQWADDAIGVLKIVELDRKVFINELSVSYPQGESEIKDVEVKLKVDPHWYPFQIVEDQHGKPQILLKEDDLTLQSLKEIWGMPIHDAVVKALTDLQERSTRVGVTQFLTCGTLC